MVLAGDRMHEPEHVGVQRLATEPIRDRPEGGIAGRLAVEGVGEDGSVRLLGEVHADLVGAPRLEGAAASVAPSKRSTGSILPRSPS